MKKAIVTNCVDPRLDGQGDKIAAVLGVDKVYQEKKAGPDLVWTNPELELERAGNLAGIVRLDGKVGGADVFALIGHTDCAGHAAPDDQHIQDTKDGAYSKQKALSETLGRPVQVVALLARKGTSDHDWDFEPLATYA